MFFVLFFQHTIDEVENLIKKHEAFEKSAAAQEERFSALRRLTTVKTIFLYALFCNLIASLCRGINKLGLSV